jgi:hypothetical protein
MNQAEIRFFVSTMNAVEENVPNQLDLSDQVQSLKDLLYGDDVISSQTRKTIEGIIARLEYKDQQHYKELDDLQDQLDLLVPGDWHRARLGDNQAWRYEPYPWLGAPASPLLPLFDLTGA